MKVLVLNSTRFHSRDLPIVRFEPTTFETDNGLQRSKRNFSVLDRSTTDTRTRWDVPFEAFLFRNGIF